MRDGWIGATDKWVEGKWQTPLAGKLPYTYWAPGEPNNNSHLGSEDCVEQWPSGGWNDRHCSYNRAFICQKTGR